MLEITPNLTIPRAELRYTAVRSSGPGGQHVNTTSSRVELHFDVANSPSLNQEQRDRIKEKLGARINREGVLRLCSSGSRSQWANKEEVTVRFVRMLRRALHVDPPRRKTRVPRAAIEKRLNRKRITSQKKQQRSNKGLED